MTLRTVTPPTLEPISLTEAKLQSSIDQDLTVWDPLLRRAIARARAHAEHITQRKFAPRVLEQCLDSWPCAHIELGTAPVQSIIHISYIDAQGAQQIILPDSGLYALNDVDEPAWASLAVGASWPAALSAPNSVRVRFVAGYAPLAADAAALDAALNFDDKAPAALGWMLMQVAEAYKNRDSKDDVPFIRNGMLDPLRLWPI